MNNSKTKQKRECSICNDRKVVIVAAGWMMGEWYDEVQMTCPYCVREIREYVLGVIASNGNAA